MPLRRTILLSLLVAQALVLSYVESWIPVPVNIPGVKLGLANIVTVLVIVLFGLKEALTVVAVRCILFSFFTGGISALLFSLSGGTLSTIIMYLMYRYLKRAFSITGVSIAGAVMHNVGQLSAAVIIMKDFAVLGYLPVLTLTGMAAGFFIGLVSHFLEKSLKRIRLG